MKYTIQILGVVFFISFLTGCSGKVQTNKIPDDKKYTLPSHILEYEKDISIEDKEDFKNYAESVLRVEKFNDVEAVANIERMKEEKKIKLNKANSTTNSKEKRYWKTSYKGSSKWKE